MKKLVVGNWKMNPASLQDAKKLFNSVKKEVLSMGPVDVVVCPPFVYLPHLKTLYLGKKIALGVQNIFYEKDGAYTGEISGSMAKGVGASHSIIGHSERRIMGESDRIVSLKIKAALSAGLVPIVCIGEKERNEEGGHFSFLASQIKESLDGLSKKDFTNIILAYEPVWAIGEASKGAMETRDIHETSLFIRKILSDMFGKKDALEARLLYGGSVDDRNAKFILNDGAVNGFLVGRASLDPIKFSKIIDSAC